MTQRELHTRHILKGGATIILETKNIVMWTDGKGWTQIDEFDDNGKHIGWHWSPRERA